LEASIRCGNSIVSDPAVDPAALDWGGERFDLVLGNPPYIRHDLLPRGHKAHLARVYAAHHGRADAYVYFVERALSLLVPGGRLCFLLSNKWLRAGYAAGLRRLLGAEARIEALVDFGPAALFPDAAAFPCLLLAQRPRGPLPATHALRVATLSHAPRTEAALADTLARRGHPVPQSRLGAGPWDLEPPPIAALCRKLHARGVPLADLAGPPRRGVVTGCNEAFLVDTKTRDHLLAEHPASAPFLRKTLRGQDISRWSPAWDGAYLLFARRGFDLAAHPALASHLERFRERLTPRPPGWEGAWPGRKANSHPWYELQDALDAFEALAAPKIVYQEIQFHPAYALDQGGLMLNNKCFFLATADPWILAALNSPLVWWLCWRRLPHLKDDALSPTAAAMERLPIALPSDEARATAERAVPRLVELAEEEQASLAALRDELRSRFGIEKGGRRLADLDEGSFLRTVRARGARAEALRRLFAAEAPPIRALRAEAAGLERGLAEAVNAAYGLTEEEVRLVRETAPPRMPGARGA
jgi:hypothetical protein